MLSKWTFIKLKYEVKAVIFFGSKKEHISYKYWFKDGKTKNKRKRKIYLLEA